MKDTNLQVDINHQINSSLEADDGSLKINRNIRDKDSIPFIAKIAKDEREEFRNMHTNNKKRKSSGNRIGEDEIDSLLNRIDKSKGKIIIDDKAKLDFDESEGQKKINNANKNMDIRDSLGLKQKIVKIEENSKNVIIPNNYENISNFINKTPSNTLIKTNKKNIIDPFLINNQEKITNSDLILCILELCINSKEYGFKYKTKSRAFWEEVLKKNSLKKIFMNFKPDTLKKYWSILAELKDYQKIVDIINQYRNMIDSDELK